MVDLDEAIRLSFVILGDLIKSGLLFIPVGIFIAIRLVHGIARVFVYPVFENEDEGKKPTPQPSFPNTGETQRLKPFPQEEYNRSIDQ